MAESAIDEYRNTAADRLHDVRQTVDRGAKRVGGASAVIRDDDAVSAVFDGELCVFGAVEPLEQHFHPRQFLQAVDVLPRRLRRIRARVAETLVHRIVDPGSGTVDVTGDAVARVLTCEPGRRRRVSAREQIDRPCNHRTSGILDPLDQLLGVAPRAWHVELIPRSAAVRLGDLLERCAGGRRQNHLVLLRARGACGRELAFAKERLLPADGTDEDRSLPFRAEHVDAQIWFRDIHQPARFEPDVFEGLHVRLQREVVLDTGGHIAPVRRRQRASCGFLEVHHLEEVLGGGRHRIMRCGQLLRPGARGWSDNSAGGDEEEELAAILREQ